MTDIHPDPKRAFPVTLPDGSVHPGTVFLSEVITHSKWHIGQYSYASDFAPPTDWASHLAPYLFEGSAETLHIGKFCQIAHGVRFITSGANHAMTGATTYPFPIFDPNTIASYQPDTRDTRIGHDVWIGYGALIGPGAQIGNGVIIGAGSVVRGQVPDYAVVTGNPGSIQRMRFSDAKVQTLLRLAWWDWPSDRIAQAQSALLANDIETLKKYAP